MQRFETFKAKDCVANLGKDYSIDSGKLLSEKIQENLGRARNGDRFESETSPKEDAGTVIDSMESIAEPMQHVLKKSCRNRSRSISI